MSAGGDERRAPGAFTDDVQFSAEDATRAIDFLWRVIEAVIQSGATTINLPDTVGYSTPDEIHAFFAGMINRVPSSDQVTWSTHCHDDLGRRGQHLVCADRRRSWIDARSTGSASAPATHRSRK
jgi:hypothetical protein